MPSDSNSAAIPSRLSAALADRYRIERELGAGGMATVYLAHDVRHERKVALKVLRPDLGAVLGADRFLSEIRVTASLQHPNILPLFDSGEAEGLLFYVMPFVEGESLRARLEREKQLPVDEAVRIAVAVASALDYAHGHGVIHRDLKPENILLQSSQPVLADFGIALAVSKAGGARITQTGLSLGTPQYMSPEQATGDRAIDGRTDIYSLGAVTYEMLTGEAPHAAATAQAIIAKLMTEEVRPLTVLRRSVPVHVDLAVRHALEKLPADRFAMAHELGDALQGRTVVTSHSAASADAGSRATRRRPVGPALEVVRLKRVLAGTAIAAVLAAAVAVGALFVGSRAEPRPTARFPLNFQSGERLTEILGSPLAISRDGQVIAYTATRGGGPAMVFLRPIGDLEAHALPGTEGASALDFSPDGRWIAFGAGGLVKKVAVDGGVPVPLASISTSNLRGLSWGGNDEIIVGASSGPLLVISAGGGAPPRPLTTFPAGGAVISHRWPLVLPDRRHVAYVSFAGSLADSRLWIASLVDGAATPLGLAGSGPLGLVDDALIYTSTSHVLMAVRLDRRRERAIGAPIPVGGLVTGDPVSGEARAALSESGSLIYQSGLSASLLVLQAPRGAARPLLAEPRAYGFPRFSPDGRKIALSIATPTGSDIWILDRATSTLTRLTTGDSVSNDRPEWSPDGKRVLYRSTRHGVALWWQPQDHSGPEELLQSNAGLIVNEGVISPDGNVLAFRLSGPTTWQDIWYRRLTGDTSSKRLITSPAYETGQRFSPDGRWLAYSSDESGTRQVYVTPFPGPGAHVQVSVDGGEEPVWTRDGRRLLYVHDRFLLAATVTLSPTFTVVAHDSLLEGSYALSYVHADYDVSPDGKEYLLLKTNTDAQTIVVTDWKTEVRRRLAAR